MARTIYAQFEHQPSGTPTMRLRIELGGHDRLEVGQRFRARRLVWSAKQLVDPGEWLKCEVTQLSEHCRRIVYHLRLLNLDAFTSQQTGQDRQETLWR